MLSLDFLELSYGWATCPQVLPSVYTYCIHIYMCFVTIMFSWSSYMFLDIMRPRSWFHKWCFDVRSFPLGVLKFHLLVFGLVLLLFVCHI